MLGLLRPHVHTLLSVPTHIMPVVWPDLLMEMEHHEVKTQPKIYVSFLEGMVVYIQGYSVMIPDSALRITLLMVFKGPYEMTRLEPRLAK